MTNTDALIFLLQVCAYVLPFLLLTALLEWKD